MGEQALICAPIGSGKTLSSFLASIDRFTISPPPSTITHVALVSGVIARWAAAAATWARRRGGRPRRGH